MTSHPEYNEKTTATEVANAFSDRIRDKHGKFLKTVLEYFILSNR